MSAAKDLRQALKSVRSARSSLRFALNLSPMSPALRRACSKRRQQLERDEAELQRLVALAEGEDIGRRVDRRTRSAA